MVKNKQLRYVTLNNKSRKGQYVYIKLGKGQRGAYYKVKKGVSDKDYIKAYKNKLISKKLGVRKGLKPEAYKSKLLKTKKIDNLLSKGIAKVEINNASNLSQYGINTAYRNLLLNKSKAGNGKSIIRDLQLTSILAREENVEKYKHRLSFKVKLQNSKGEILAELTSIGKKTLRTVLKDMKSIMKVGTDIVDFSPSIAMKMKEKGYSYAHQNNGKYAKMNISIILRKAK